MGKNPVSRRDFLTVVTAGTLAWGSGDLLRGGVQNDSRVLQIRMERNYSIGRYYFDPIGLYVRPGETVQWFSVRDGFSATAYHPDHDNHELRIPEKAEPFDSGILWRGESFQWRFEVEGTYDYYSRSHEVIGAVGRIVVGAPGGPAEKPLNYGTREGRAPLFTEAIRTLEIIRSDEIVQEKVIPYPRQKLGRRFPQY